MTQPSPKPKFEWGLFILEAFITLCFIACLGGLAVMLIAGWTENDTIYWIGLMLALPGIALTGLIFAGSIGFAMWDSHVREKEKRARHRQEREKNADRA